MHHLVPASLIPVSVLALLLTACAQGSLDATDGGVVAQGGELSCGQSGSEVGQCEGAWLVFCFEGEVRRLDCTLVDAECGFDPLEAINRCVPPGTGEPPRQPVVPDTPEDPPADSPADPPVAPPTDPPPEPVPPGNVCDGVADGRRCEGEVVIICRNGEPAGRTNCSANGLVCATLPDGSDGCTDPGRGGPEPPQGPGELPQEGLCGGVAIGSRCDGASVVSCREGAEESRFNCANDGQSCAQFDDQWAGCEGAGNNNPPPVNPEPEPAGCGEVPFWGQCTGDVYEVCNLFDDEVITIDCSSLGASCGQSPEGLIGCIWQ